MALGRNWRFSIPQCSRIDFFTSSMLSSEVRKNLTSVELFPFTVRSSRAMATALSPGHFLDGLFRLLRPFSYVFNVLDAA